MPVHYQRIAVVRLCGIGDAVQLTPLLQQLRADVPAGKIELFVNEDVASLFDNCPFVDVVHALPFAWFLNQKGNRLCWRLWRQVRAAGPFDLLLNLSVAWLNTLLSAFTRARRRAGLVSPHPKPWQPWHYHQLAVRDLQLNRTHTSQLYLNLWSEASGHADRGFGYALSHLRGAEEGLPRHVCLATGAGNAVTPGDMKRWPPRKWLALAEGLVARGYVPFFIGTAGDMGGLAVPEGAVNLLGKQTLLEAVRLMARCAGLVGHDSGLYQIALGLDIPAFGLFGPTSPVHTGPFRNPKGRAMAFQLPCVPCWDTSCKVEARGRPETARPFCMSELPVEDVLEAFLGQLEQSPGQEKNRSLAAENASLSL